MFYCIVLYELLYMLHFYRIDAMLRLAYIMG